MSIVSIEQIVLLLVAVALVALIFYVSSALVSTDWSVDGPFVLRLLLVSIIAVLVIPFVSDLAHELGVGELGLLFGFVILIFVVRYVLVEELPVADDWLASIVITLLGVVLIYAVQELADRFFDTRMLSVL